MINGLSNKTILFILFISGALLPLAFAPINLIPFAYLSPAVLYLFLFNVTKRQAFWRAYVFGIAMFGVGISWVFVAINDFGNSPTILALLLTFIFILFVALVIAFQGLFSAWVITLFSNYKYNRVISLLGILPTSWVLFEWLRGTIFTGFPWLNLGYSQIDTSLTGFATIFGVYGVSWVVAFCAGLILLFWSYLSNLQWRSASFAIITFASFYISGFLLTNINWTSKIDEPLKVSLVQGNAAQITKWDQEQINKRLNLYKSLTEQHWDSDIIIWPENSLTVFYHELKDSYLRLLEKQALENNTDLVIGIPVQDFETKQYYSTFMSFGRSPGVYKKTHLVPFGEFIPFENQLRGLIAFFNLPMSGFSRGNIEQPLLKAAGQLLAVTICFEDVFGEEVIRQLPEATILVNGSNNAWYGNSFAPHQHLQISRMRAVEVGRELMRVTTNGISAFVNYKGELLLRSPQFETYVLTSMVQPRTGLTPYVFWGNKPILILFIIFLGLILYRYKFNKVSGV